MRLSDQDWMHHAIRLAQRAQQGGEVPVGAVLVKGDRCFGEGWNCPIGTNDPTAHAEIVALRAAGRVLGNYRLPDTTLYVTLEPCAMCIGAIVHARVRRLVFGATDPKRGAVCSAIQLLDADFHNHTVVWQGGIFAELCGSMLKAFFAEKR